MKKMNMIWTKIAALALGAVMALGIGATVSSVSPISAAEAATTQTTRRIYAYTKDAWGKNANLYIHYWGGVESNFNDAPPMTLVLSDFWNGFYFYDVPIATTGFLLKNAASGDGTLKTSDIAISSCFSGTDYLVTETWNGGGAVYFQTTIGLNSGQAAAILNHIDSCSTSYAGGYNAWPQLDDLFISSSTLDGTTEVIDNFGPTTTIDAKTAYLEARYNADQASSAQNVLAPIDDKNRITITVLFSIIGLSLVGGLYFYSRKKQSSI